MNEQLLARRLAQLDAVRDPDRAFADRLYERLAGDLDFRPESTPWWRIGRRLGMAPLPTGSAAFRLAYLAASVGLLIALLGATVWIGSHLQRRSGADEIVRLSQEAWAHPPAFTMTITTGDARTFTVSSDGAGTFRTDGDAAKEGGYQLFDGERMAVFERSDGSWAQGDWRTFGAPPFPFDGAYSWSAIDGTGTSASRRQLSCDGAELLDPAIVAGRPVDRVRCPGADATYWLDRDTHLTLRIELGPAAPNGGAVLADGEAVLETTAFTIDGPAAARFSWVGPVAAAQSDEAEASTTLVPGHPAPRIEVRDIEGATLATDALGGPAAVVVAVPCLGRCLATYDALADFAGDHPELRAVVVGLWTERGTMAGYASLHPTPASVVADPEQVFVDTWGLSAWPATVLLDADGRVAAMWAGSPTPASLTGALEALLAGDPVPPIELAPGPTPLPERSPAPGTTPDPGLLEFSGLQPGDAAPEWRARLLDGGSIASEGLLGRPTAMVFWSGAPCLGCEPEGLPEIAALQHAMGDRVNLVLVVEGEREPGVTAAALAAEGSGVVAVGDWDGAVQEAFMVGMQGTVLVDAAGRVTGGHVGIPTRQELEALVRPGG
jgi:peroxiredoxin